MHDRRFALSEKEVERIQQRFFKGEAEDYEIAQLFDTIRVQRTVLKELFQRYQTEPLRRVSTADPIPNSALTYLKELVAMADAKP